MLRTVALASLLASCGERGPEAAEPENVVDRAVGELQDLAHGDRERAERALEEQIDHLHDSLDDWAQSARRSGAQVRDDVLARLKEQEADLRTELEVLRRSTGDAWQQVCRDTQEGSARFAEECRKLFEQR
jgi:DNA anti-recombination protein RmuC